MFINNASAKIDNSIYDQLGNKWYEAWDNPIALLRAESKIKLNWLASFLPTGKKLKILDIGCGAGFISNELARLGHDVVGLDLSESSLDIARQTSGNATPEYVCADAYHLPFEDESFDLIVCFDFLEHVEKPNIVVSEASRVLRKKGRFCFHTFNRNLLSYVVVIKFMEWFVPNTPKNMHVLNLFIRPSELNQFCQDQGMQVFSWTGIRPVLFTMANLKGVLKRAVPKCFSFKLSNSLLTSYMGIAEKV